MHVFLIAAITANGFIAEAVDQISTSWTSKEDRKFFSQRTKQAGVIVMGSSTYKTIGRPLPERLTIVYSKSDEMKNIAAEINDEKVLRVTELSPADLIKKLAQEGYSEVAICGGASIYSLFMNAGMIDTLYLTIEPVLFGSGIRIFDGLERTPVTFKNLSKLSDQTIVLEYAVNKNMIQ